MINSQAISNLLESCRTMKQLKQLQVHMITTSLAREIVPLSRLLDFCTISEQGDLSYARTLFDQISQPTSYMWNSMLRGYTDKHKPEQALLIYKQMHQAGATPNNFTFPFMLKACSQLSQLDHGKCVHDRILKSGFESDLYVCSSLIHMYGCCGELEDARQLFDKIPMKNVVVWTTMIDAYVNNSLASDSLELFKEMNLAGVAPNERTMVNVLAACAQTRDLEMGRWAHDMLNRIGLDPIQSNSNSIPNVILATAILDMYAKCGGLGVARQVFDKMFERNVVSWNTMIGAYNQYEQPTRTLELFFDMRLAGVKPDKVTLLSILSACAHLGDLGSGQGIHAYTYKTNFDRDLSIGTSLIDMYGKSGDTSSASQVFRGLPRKDVLAWTSMIIGLAMNEHGEDALNLFDEMREDGIIPDHITYIGVLCACSHGGLVAEGQAHFNSMSVNYGIMPLMEHYGCMIDLLSRSGHLIEAEKLVESIPIKPNVALWSALLSGCMIHGNVDVAERVRNHMIELNPQKGGVHVLLSNIYAKVGRWQEVNMSRELMRHRGVEKTPGYSLIQVNNICL